MPVNLKGRSLTTLLDYSAEEIRLLIDFAIKLKKEKQQRIFPCRLKNRNIAAVFLKQSCRTRGAFSVAVTDEGAHMESFTREESRFGIKESARDIARVLGSMFDGIAFRGYEHTTVNALAQWAGIPVWNALCDLYHPTQALADLMTIMETFGNYQQIKMAYIGDGRNNVANSLLIASLKLGIDFRIVAPPPLHPATEMVECFFTRSRERDPEIKKRLMITDSIPQGVKGCHVIYTDVWASMGEEHLIPERIKLLKDYKITRGLMDLTGNPDVIFLHCLPALHDLETETARRYPDLQEVEDEVFESNRSPVFVQAGNRMHTIKALLLQTIG